MSNSTRITNAEILYRKIQCGSIHSGGPHDQDWIWTSYAQFIYFFFCWEDQRSKEKYKAAARKWMVQSTVANMLSNKCSKPGWIIYGSNNRLDMEIHVKSIHSHISSKPAHFIPSIGAIIVEPEVTVDPDDTSTDWSRNSVRHVQVVGHNACC